jgi:hypothetical protein
MSQLGQKRRFMPAQAMSAPPPVSGPSMHRSTYALRARSRLMRCSKVKLFDHLIGGHLERRWDREAKRFGGPHVDSEIEARGALER